MADDGRRMLRLIEQTKRRRSLTSDEVAWLVNSYLRDEVPDYQVAAWLMAVRLNGLSADETVALTAAMVDSGQRLDLAGHGIVAADKHSTGGIGDKTTLVLAPLVAAAGLPVAKMSGRGLGFTGGTLDKLEALPGLRVDLSGPAFLRQVESIGLVIAGQSVDLVPGDGKLYALRDVTGTVDSIPLIASSVMAKKIASGARFLILDVKMGDGAFIDQPAAARELAQTMLTIGKDASLQMAAALSWMDQPLGFAIGNALELAEAVDTLRDGGPGDLRELCLRLGAELLQMQGPALDATTARRQLESVLASGAALRKLQAMVAAQGGDPRALDDLGLLPRAPVQLHVTSPRGGYVQAIAGRALGYAAIALGAGRTYKGQRIDHATGLVLRAKMGTPVARGDVLATVHARDDEAARGSAPAVQAAFTIGDQAPPSRPLVADVLR
jgi:pyrimidine-nucleoside phosphorylase